MNDIEFIRANTLAFVLDLSEVGLAGLILKGRIPPPDIVTRLPHPRTRAWKFSTLQRWRPDIAAACATALKALDAFPARSAQISTSQKA